MLDFFGYNLIETAAAPLMPGNSASPAEQVMVARRRDALVDSIRRNGKQHRVFFNGTLFIKDARVPYGPDTHHLYEEYFRRTAEAVAPYAGSVLTHWLDDGGWKSTPAHPCTIAVLQDLHMQIHRAFKKVNPKIQSVLSLWALDEVGPGTDNLGWQGYEGVDSILKSGLVPPEVGLAMSGKVRMSEARKITASGRLPGAPTISRNGCLVPVWCLFLKPTRKTWWEYRELTERREASVLMRQSKHFNDSIQFNGRPGSGIPPSTSAFPWPSATASTVRHSQALATGGRLPFRGSGQSRDRWPARKGRYELLRNKPPQPSPRIYTSLPP